MSNQFPEITALIPHRHPFLLVEKIVALTETSIKTEKNLNPEGTVYQGHYPGNPLTPGVLICEAIFQSGALLIAHLLQQQASESESTKVPVLTRIKDAKFKRMVLPGERLDMSVEITEKLGSAYFMKGVASVAGAVAVRVTFAATLAEPT